MEIPSGWSVAAKRCTPSLKPEPHFQRQVVEPRTLRGQAQPAEERSEGEPLEQQPEQSEGEEHGGRGKESRRAPCGRSGAAVARVLANAGGIGHDVGDVVLLMDSVEEVRHGTLGEDGHVFPSMRLHAHWDGGLSLVVGIR